MVAGSLVPYGGHCVVVLHPFLYPFFCTDGIAHQRRGERDLVGGAVWNGKDLSVWWSDHPRRGRCTKAQGPLSKEGAKCQSLIKKKDIHRITELSIKGDKNRNNPKTEN